MFSGTTSTGLEAAKKRHDSNKNPSQDSRNAFFFLNHIHTRFGAHKTHTMAEDQSYSQQSQQYDQQSAQQSEMSSVEQLPEVLYLMQFCAQAFSPQGDTEEARVEANASWDPVREWLSSHSPAEVREAAEQRDDVGKTALHFACQNAPPLDIIKAFLNQEQF